MTNQQSVICTQSDYFGTGLDKQNFERKFVNIFLPISLNICFGCSTSHRDSSFEYPQHTFWLRNKNIIFLVHTFN